MQNNQLPFLHCVTCEISPVDRAIAGSMLVVEWVVFGLFLYGALFLLGAIDHQFLVFG